MFCLLSHLLSFVFSRSKFAETSKNYFLFCSSNALLSLALPSVFFGLIHDKTEERIVMTQRFLENQNGELDSFLRLGCVNRSDSVSATRSKQLPLFSEMHIQGTFEKFGIKVESPKCRGGKLHRS